MRPLLQCDEATLGTETCPIKHSWLRRRHGDIKPSEFKLDMFFWCVGPAIITDSSIIVSLFSRCIDECCVYEMAVINQHILK